jgi:excisionase family DNA binding protein
MENIDLDELAEKVAKIILGEKQNTTPPDIISFKVAYKLLLKKYYAEGTIRNLIRKKAIPYHKQGGSIKFKVTELQEWLNQKHIPQ